MADIRAALVNSSTSVVENVIMFDPDGTFNPGEGFEVVPDHDGKAWIGATWDGTSFSPMPVPPFIFALTPETAVMGSPDLTLTISGEGFSDGNSVVFGGVEQPATFVSDAELTTTVKPSEAPGPWATAVQIRDGTGTDSSTRWFTFTETT